MKGKDYTVKKAQEAAQKMVTAQQNAASQWFIGTVSEDKKTITDNTTGQVYNLSFTGNPKKVEMAYRLSPTDAIVPARDIKHLNVDGGQNALILFSKKVPQGVTPPWSQITDFIGSFINPINTADFYRIPYELLGDFETPSADTITGSSLPSNIIDLARQFLGYSWINFPEYSSKFSRANNIITLGAQLSPSGKHLVIYGIYSSAPKDNSDPGRHHQNVQFCPQIEIRTAILFNFKLNKQVLDENPIGFSSEISYHIDYESLTVSSQILNDIEAFSSLYVYPSAPGTPTGNDGQGTQIDIPSMYITEENNVINFYAIGGYEAEFIAFGGFSGTIASPDPLCVGGIFDCNVHDKPWSDGISNFNQIIYFYLLDSSNNLKLLNLVSAMILAETPTFNYRDTSFTCNGLQYRCSVPLLQNPQITINTSDLPEPFRGSPFTINNLPSVFPNLTNAAQPLFEISYIPTTSSQTIRCIFNNEFGIVYSSTLPKHTPIFSEEFILDNYFNNSEIGFDLIGWGKTNLLTLHASGQSLQVNNILVRGDLSNFTYLDGGNLPENVSITKSRIKVTQNAYPNTLQLVQTDIIGLHDLEEGVSYAIGNAPYTNGVSFNLVSSIAI